MTELMDRTAFITRWRKMLKLDFEVVYQAYLAKNKVNYQRQNRGY